MTNELDEESYGKRHQNPGTTWTRCLGEEEEVPKVTQR